MHILLTLFSLLTAFALIEGARKPIPNAFPTTANIKVSTEKVCDNKDQQVCNKVQVQQVQCSIDASNPQNQATCATSVAMEKCGCGSSGTLDFPSGTATASFVFPAGGGDPQVFTQSAATTTTTATTASSSQTHQIPLSSTTPPSSNNPNAAGSAGGFHYIYRSDNNQFEIKPASSTSVYGTSLPRSTIFDTYQSSQVASISNRQHCSDFFENKVYASSWGGINNTAGDECDVPQANTIEVNLDSQSSYLNSREDFNFLEVMTDHQFPPHSPSTISIDPHQRTTKDPQDKQVTTLNSLFNRLFNPPTFIFSQQMQSVIKRPFIQPVISFYLTLLSTLNSQGTTKYTHNPRFNIQQIICLLQYQKSNSQTLIETSGEIKIVNHSEGYLLQIFDIIPDIPIITVEKKQEDILPQKERVFRFYIVPEEAGLKQEVNLYFKIRFYDSKLLKTISSRTVQYTILLSNVKENRYGLKPQDIGKIQVGIMMQGTLKISNPQRSDIIIKEITSVKKHVFLVESFESLQRGEKTYSLNYKNLIKKEAWHLSATVTETKIINYVAVYDYTQVGRITDYLRIILEGTNPLIVQIPIRIKVVRYGINFKHSFLHMGLMTSTSQGHNSRLIVVDNDSDGPIEIKDILVQCKSSYSCMTIEAKVELYDENMTPRSPQTSQAASMGCLDEAHRVIVKPRERNRVIGILRVFPRSDKKQTAYQTNSQQRTAMEGRISLITNSTHGMSINVNPNGNMNNVPNGQEIGIEFRFFRSDQIMSYSSASSSTTSNVTEFEVVRGVTLPTEWRLLEVTNLFSTQIKVTGLALPASTPRFRFEDHFEIQDFSERIVDVGEKKDVFRFRLKSKRNKLHTYVLLELNRNFFVPVFLRIYNMRLLCAIGTMIDYTDCSELATNSRFSFGNKSFNQNNQLQLRVKNPNPSPLGLQMTLSSTSHLSLLLDMHINSKGQPQSSKMDIPLESVSQQQSETTDLVMSQSTSLRSPQVIQMQANDEAVFTLELSTQSTPLRGKEQLTIISEFEKITFGIDYRILKGQLTINPTDVHFPATTAHQVVAYPVYIKNSFSIDAKLEAIFTSDPRFKIFNQAKTIPAGSEIHAFDITFDRFYKSNGNQKGEWNEEQFISEEEIFRWKNSEKQKQDQPLLRIAQCDVRIRLDLQSLTLIASADVEDVRILTLTDSQSQNQISFNNTEANSFSSKTLVFSNPLDMPIAFQLYLAPDHLLSTTDSKKNTRGSSSEEEDEVDYVFCVPINLYRQAIVKEVFDSLSSFFSNSSQETLSEIQDEDVLKQILAFSELDKQVSPSLLRIADQVRMFSNLQGDISMSDFGGFGEPMNASSSQKSLRLGGFSCKEGKMSEKTRKILIRIEFQKQFVEFVDDPESRLRRIRESLTYISSLNRENYEISSLSRNRPSLYNFGMRPFQRGLIDKMKAIFINLISFSSNTSNKQENYLNLSSFAALSIAEWQSSRTLRTTSTTTPSIPNDKSEQSSTAQQQFFLSSEVANKTIILQPKSTVSISALMYLPRVGTASSNLIIKSNGTDLRVYPISGRSGVGAIRLVSIRGGIDEESQTPLYRQWEQDYIANNTMLFAITDSDLRSSSTPLNKIELLRNFIIRNTGEFPISVRTIYVGSEPCTGSGFYVVGCTVPFTLDPNAERTITVSYSTNYPQDSIETSLYFYASTYKISLRLRAEFTNQTLKLESNNSPATPTSHTSAQNYDDLNEYLSHLKDGLLSKKNNVQTVQSIDQDKLINSMRYNRNNNNNSSNPKTKSNEIITNQDTEDLNNESQKLLLELLDNIEKAAQMTSQGFTEKLHDTVDSSLEAEEDEENTPFTEYISSWLLSAFVQAILLSTILFFFLTFITFFTTDVVHRKQRTHTSKSSNTATATTANNNLSDKEAQQSSSTNPSISNLPRSQFTSSNYDISLFISQNQPEPGVLNLRGELQKIKEIYERSQITLKLQKQQQISQQQLREKLKQQAETQIFSQISHQQSQQRYAEDNQYADAENDEEDNHPISQNNSNQNTSITSSNKTPQQTNQSVAESTSSNQTQPTKQEQTKPKPQVQPLAQRRPVITKEKKPSKTPKVSYTKLSAEPQQAKPETTKSKNSETKNVNQILESNNSQQAVDQQSGDKKKQTDELQQSKSIQVEQTHVEEQKTDNVTIESEQKEPITPNQKQNSINLIEVKPNDRTERETNTGNSQKQNDTQKQQQYSHSPNNPDHQPIQTPKKSYIVHDNLSSCSEDEEIPSVVKLKSSPPKQQRTDFPQLQSLSGLTNNKPIAPPTQFLVQSSCTSKNNSDDEIENANENQNEIENENDSDGSMLSSGDSLSEEDIDTFKRSNHEIKAVSQQQKFPLSHSSKLGFNITEDDQESGSSNSNSLRNSFVESFSKQPLNGSHAFNQQSLRFQSEESSDEESMQPISQPRTFNMFSTSPCFYPINYLHYNSSPKNQTDEIDTHSALQLVDLNEPEDIDINYSTSVLNRSINSNVFDEYQANNINNNTFYINRGQNAYTQQVPQTQQERQFVQQEFSYASGQSRMMHHGYNQTSMNFPHISKSNNNPSRGTLSKKTQQKQTTANKNRQNNVSFVQSQAQNQQHGQHLNPNHSFPFMNPNQMINLQSANPSNLNFPIPIGLPPGIILTQHVDLGIPPAQQPESNMQLLPNEKHFVPPNEKKE